jgi:hypothetical protein
MAETTSQAFPLRPAPAGSRGPGPFAYGIAPVPDLYISQPIIRDPLETSTSEIQDETVAQCLPYLRGGVTSLNYNRHGVPNLVRGKHKNFLKRNLRMLPAPFVAADASRPWMLLWNLTGLTLLGEDVSSYETALIDTALTMQNRSGGFGGGHGQTSHLATTYACVLALAVCGTQEAYDVIDRRALWKWLCSLKQPNGGFQIAYGGEVDVRYVPVLEILSLFEFSSTAAPDTLDRSPFLERLDMRSVAIVKYTYACITTNLLILSTGVHIVLPLSSACSISLLTCLLIPLPGLPRGQLYSQDWQIMYVAVSRSLESIEIASYM